jgi:hypothetical protein
VGGEGEEEEGGRGGGGAVCALVMRQERKAEFPCKCTPQIINHAHVFYCTEQPSCTWSAAAEGGRAMGDGLKSAGSSFQPATVPPLP